MNNIDSQSNLKTKHNPSIYRIVLIVFILIGLTMIICGVYLNSNKTIESKPDNYLSSIEIRGYNLDKPFSKDKYEYSLNVDEDIIQIVCETEGKVEGCNETIDLTNKEKYVHKIIVNNKEYKITINKIIEKTELRITSVNGNPLEWTNKDVEIEVNAISNNGVEGYSFDGGKTYQESNKIKVKENKIVNIVIKDKKGNTTEIKEVKIDKIDKEIPKVEIIIESKTKDEIKLFVKTKDEISGISGISFNNSEYTTKDTYIVTKSGTYSVIVKDKAGNVSDIVTKEIKKIDFGVTENAFIATFHGNGANISREYLLCSTNEGKCEITLPTITREGYEILGWSTSKDSKTVKYNSGEKITITDSKDYYAITRKLLTTTFNKNGATSIGTTTKTCYLYNQESTCSVSFPKIVREGYDIIGWSKDKKATTSEYKPEQNISVSENKEYYAITRKTVTLKFNKNGSDLIETSNKTCNMYNTDANCSIVLPKIERPGYQIVGWSTNKDAKTAVGNQDDTLTVNKNTTYYAITKKVLTLTLNQNGASTIGVSKKTCEIYNNETSCKVEFPTITREGGEVIGWSTNKTGTSKEYITGDKIELFGDKTYYAITRKAITLTFNSNGADVISSTNISCHTYNTEKSCSVTLPAITRNGGEVIGWSSTSNATTATYNAGQKVTISDSSTYYAITKKTITATFNLGVSSRSCTIYNTNNQCGIVMPVFNIVGSFNSSWGTNKDDPEAKYKVGTTYEFSDDINLYGSIKHWWRAEDEIEIEPYKITRTLNMNQPVMIGNTIIEYENNIPSQTINSHLDFLNTLKNTHPYLFVPEKIFVMEYDTYYTYSRSLGLTHTYGSYAQIDLLCDKNKEISLNATIHEMTHAWDYYYGFKTGGKNLRDQPDFVEFYKSLGSKLTLTKTTEILAAMYSNYYWHALENDTSKGYYGLCTGCSLTQEEKNELKTIIEKYAKISNNNYIIN